MNLIQLKTKFLNLLYATTKWFHNPHAKVVLAYHSISNSKDQFAVSKTEFVKQIEKLTSYAKFVSLNDLLDKTFQGTIMSLTIDDGFKDVLSVTDFLQEKNIQPTLFVLANPSKADKKELGNDGALLNRRELLMLKKLGWTFGSHSMTHAYLPNLSDKELRTEIITSKKTLEKQLGQKVNYFAYPKGKHTEKIIRIAKEAGYTHAFTINPGSVKEGLDPFVLPRTMIDKSHSIESFPAIHAPTTYFIRRLLQPFNIWERFFRYEN